MSEKAIPVYEAKNRLSYFLHEADSNGPVFISSRGKASYVILSISDYERAYPKKDSVYESVQKIKRKYGLENDDFDYTAFFESLRKDR